MLRIRDLGKDLRKQFPNQFDHLSDEEVGRAAKAAAEAKELHIYDEYDEEEEVKLDSIPEQPVLKKEVFSDIIQDLTNGSEIKANPNLDKYSQELDNYLDPHRGVFTSWWQTRKAKGRAELAAELTAEKMNVVRQTMMLAEQVRAGRRSEIEYKRFIVDNATALMEARSKVNRIIEADKLNIPEADFTELRVQDLTEEQNFGHYQKRAAFDANLEVSKARHMSSIETDAKIEIAELESDLRIKEFTERDKVEWTRYRNEKELDVQAAIIANIAPVFEANALTTQLFNVIDQMQQLQLNPMDKATEEKIRALKRTKKYLERCINERFEGLLQSVPKGRKKFRQMEEDE